MKQAKKKPLTDDRTTPVVAVVGAGAWGRNLVRNFYELGTLKTVCDVSPAALQEIDRDFQRLCLTPDITAILDDPEIDAVVISTPAVTHFGIARMALTADKHVYVEKPLSMTYADGLKLLQLAEKRKKVLFVGHILQYHAAVVKLKELVKQGVIGRLQYIYSRRLSLGKIRREENSLWSFAPHDLSIILSMVEESPSFVDSVGSNFVHTHIADVTMTNLKFPSGVGAHIFVSWLNPYKEQKLVAIGNEGMLVFDDTQPLDQKLLLYPHTVQWKNGMPVPLKAKSVEIDLSDAGEDPLKAACRALIESVNTGKKPLTSGEEGLGVLKVLDACQRSLEEKEHSSRLNPDVFVHPTAVIDEKVSLGKGTKVWHFSHILSGSKTGENCTIGQNVVIGPDVNIGKNCKIQNNVSVYKGVTLEDGVFCGPSMVFTNVFNPRAEISKMDQVKPTLVRKGATIGANATIVCGCEIGRYAFVGAGAVVTKDVQDHAIMVGNPARQIGWACACGGKLSRGRVCDECGRKHTLSGKGLKDGE
jgi:UDP-2-acetamido-3-amino-2,3-dideoxy-glucuronate N-acetyltransferase